jgi:two-component system chemotaxis sensor kinase CheA
MIKGLDRILQDFLVESQEGLDQLDQKFVDLERHPDDQELLGGIFRTMHSIKGSAGFLNLPQLEQVSHYAEDVLAKIRDQSLVLNGDITTVMLHAVDGIKSILVHLEKTGQEGEHAVEAVVEDLKTIIVGGSPQATRPAEAESSEVPQKGTKKTRRPVEKVAPTPAESEQPKSEQPKREPDESALKEPQGANEGERLPAGVEDTRIHVDIGLLDQVMNLTGELVLARNRIVQLASTEKVEPQAFRATAQRLNTIVSELQETVMKTRMQPVRKVFGMFPRLVRDLSKAHGKDVTLRMEGQDTELDRTLLEAIKDPLTHLVRNAIDHGIESAEVRRKHGKSPTGTILIHAYPEGGQVHIDITDDGAGIDLGAVKAKAVQEGILTPQRAEEITERDLLHLIFRPGFSTASMVTSISGRGVGMDVVKRNLARIGGTVELRTERQKGTTITLCIPITLAIISVLIVKAAQQRFAIPQINLEELVMLQDQDGGGARIERVYGAEVYRLRGELLPLLRLNQVLRLPSPVQSVGKGTNIIVVSAGTTRFGIVVDDVGDTEEIVVKPLSPHVRQIPCYDGATIMGDGKVALILNINGLSTAAEFNLEDLHAAEEAAQKEEAQKMEGAPEEHRQTIVLFRAGQNEYYGVPLAFVVRLEEFPSSQIEHSGGREVLQYRGDILPLIRLEPYLNLPLAPDPATLSLIVFSVEKQIGLVVKEIINTVEISTHIDTETFQQKGILGSTIVEGHSVLILDIHGLIEMAYPTWYKKFLVSKLEEAERARIRVLLAEDSAFFLNIEKSYLESAGYQVVTATNGLEAVKILEQRPVDVVVTDIAMPYCDGYELTRTIKAREEWKHLPVMAITALSGEEDRRKGIEAGIEEYKIKLDRDEVLRTLELLILRHRKKE